MRLGGNPNNRSALLGQFEVQFGGFNGKTFKWILENDLGYSAWLVNNMSGKTLTSPPLSVNKHFFKEYLNSFTEGKEALALKAAEKTAKQASSSSSLQPTTTRKSSTTAASLFNRSSLSPQVIAKRLQKNTESLGKIQPHELFSQGKSASIL